MQHCRRPGITRLGHFFHPAGVAGGLRRLSVAVRRHNTQLADEHNIDRTNRAVDYIFAHYARELTLEEVAEHLGMKPTYFSRVFKQATGRNFIEFVNRLRISKSCELLADGDKPVTDVCFESGFNNISNFNRRFQQLKGMTPSHYRRLAVQRLTEQKPDQGCSQQFPVGEAPVQKSIGSSAMDDLSAVD
jgi:AraC-like DNA-binding protein